jgi:iron complex transport system ATP-binding protein
MKLKVENVGFSYAALEVLKDVCVELGASEILGIVGPNGSGKSTLIRCIDKILVPKEGSILLDGAELKKMSRMAVARKMGYVPQAAAQVFSNTVFDVVLMGRRPHLSWQSGKRDEKIVLETLQLLNIEGLAMRDINELSGGQQQKVFIARALAQEPEVLLFDEPTSNLDIRHALEVMEIMKSLVVKKGLSAIMAIHDLNLAARYAGRLIMLNEGRIFAVGSAATVLTPENISAVYEVEVKVYNGSEGMYILPLRPA